MKLSDLNHNPENPRQISDEKLEMLRASLAQFGELSGFVFNRRSQTLIGGHQRSKVLPLDAEIVIEHAYSDPTNTGTVAQGYVLIDGERFNYREVDWDEKKEKAANIAANQHGGEWNLPRLSQWLIELDDGEFNMDLLGFSAQEREDLIVPVEKLEPGEGEDEAPEAPLEPKTKLGDIYKLGSHRLMCGDATSLDAMQQLIDGQTIDLVFTDPPYGVEVVKSGTVGGADFGVAKKGQYAEIIGDDTTDCAREFYSTCQALELKKFIIWGGNYFTNFLEPSNSWIVWNKRGDTDIVNSFADGELAWTNLGFPVRIHHQLWNGMIRQGEREKRVHPTQKPIALVEYCLELAKNCGSVLDGFGGSGSTLIACEKMKRRSYLMELSPAYCDVIVARWEKYTGKTAELVTPGSSD